MKEEYLKWPWGINDTIENLKETKKNLQIIALTVNAWRPLPERYKEENGG